MIDFFEFYKYGMAFSACCGVIFGITHEVTKYVVKRYGLKIPYK